MSDVIQAQDSTEDKIFSPYDLVFQNGAWKTIAVTGVLGLVISFLYLLITPNQFKATANITVARVLTIGGGNIEEPSALVARMSLPTSFDDNVIQACGLVGVTNINGQLKKVIKLTTSQHAIDVVELAVTRPTPELASTCAESVYDAIANFQSQLIDIRAQIFTDSNNLNLINMMDKRLAKDNALLEKVDQSCGGLSPLHSLILTEIRTLKDERDKFQMIFYQKDVRATQLQSPIRVVEKPDYPKKAGILIAGISGELFFGLLIALGRKMIAKLNS